MSMILLNTLFPTVVHLQDTEDFNPSPLSPHLRDSIRLSIYQHLMSQSPFSRENQEVIKTKIFSWCNISSYDESKDALTRYVEDVVKLEETCFKLLESVSPDQTGSTADSTSSLLHSSDGPSSQVLDQHSWRHLSDNCPGQEASQHRPRVCSAPPAADSVRILKGVSGREILGAATDPSAFIEGLPSPALSKALKEYDEHPLAKHLDMSIAEKASLGLLLPRTVEFPAA